VTVNVTSPIVNLTGSGKTTQFSISIQKISELAGDDELRSVDLSHVNFNLVTVAEGLNEVGNYSAQLENGASVYVVVSC
jgi:hypothetical protein